MRLSASCDTSSAENALRCISHDRRSQPVYRGRSLGAFIHSFSCAGNLSYIEKFALAVLLAFLAVPVVVGKQKFYGSPSGLSGLRRTDGYFHAVGNRIYAGSYKFLRSVVLACLYQTYSAGSK